MQIQTLFHNLEQEKSGPTFCCSCRWPHHENVRYTGVISAERLAKYRFLDEEFDFKLLLNTLTARGSDFCIFCIKSALFGFNTLESICNAVRIVHGAVVRTQEQ